jgi:hypothetical protein
LYFHEAGVTGDGRRAAAGRCRSAECNVPAPNLSPGETAPLGAFLNK